MDLFASAVEFRLCRQPQARKNRGGLGDTLALGLDPRVPQRGAGDARRDPAAGRSDVQTKSPARAANSLALFAWCRRRTPPPDAADDFLLNSKKVMPRRPPPSRVRGRVARTRLSLLTTHQTYPRTPLPPHTPRSFPPNGVWSTALPCEGSAVCGKAGFARRWLLSPWMGSGPAHPQRRDSLPSDPSAGNGAR